MRSLVIGRPDNGIRITHLADGKALVQLYTSYIEQPIGSMTLETANIVGIVVDDSPELEEEVLHNWQRFYDMAIAQEIDYLRGQYKKTVDNLLSGLPPEQKESVVELSEGIIRKIAHGDQPFLIRQDLLKKLKQNI